MRRLRSYSDRSTIFVPYHNSSLHYLLPPWLNHASWTFLDEIKGFSCRNHTVIISISNAITKCCNDPAVEMLETFPHPTPLNTIMGGVGVGVGTVFVKILSSFLNKCWVEGLYGYHSCVYNVDTHSWTSARIIQSAKGGSESTKPRTLFLMWAVLCGLFKQFWGALDGLDDPCNEVVFG